MADFDWGNFLSTAGNNILNNVGQGLSNAASNPMLVPAAATAYQQWKQAGDYQDQAEKYASKMDPFGSQREMYQGKLADIWNDPGSFLNSEPYQKLRSMRTSEAFDKAGAAGLGNSGAQMKSMMDMGAAMDWEQIAKMRDQLALNAGAQIGPGYSAALLAEGMKGKKDSQNAAMAALGQMFAPKAPTGGGMGGGMGGGGVSGDVASQLSNAFKSGGPEAAVKLLSQLWGSGVITPQQANQILQDATNWQAANGDAAAATGDPYNSYGDMSGNYGSYDPGFTGGYDDPSVLYPTTYDPGFTGGYDDPVELFGSFFDN